MCKRLKKLKRKVILTDVKMVCSNSKELLKELGDALKSDSNSHETISSGGLVIDGTPAEATLTKMWNEAGTCVYPNEK